MPDIDPDTALRLAKTVADIYGDAAARLLETVARRLADGITEPGWAEAKLAELLGVRNDARTIIAELDNLVSDAVTAAITEGATIGTKVAAIELHLAPRTNTAAVDALARETIDALTDVHGAILRTTLDTYRTIIAEVSAPGVVTGTETRRQATQRALNRFADRGIVGFTDRAGRRWEIESYAEMATRTASGRAMVNGRVEQYTAAGRTLVIVSNAPQECSKCRPFEGKLLSLDGEHVGTRQGGIVVVDTLDGARSRGFQHANCRHDLRPFVAGLTKPMAHTADPDGDEARQRQRYLERGLRQWKRRAAVALDDAERAKANRAIGEWRTRLKDHVDANDLKRQPASERVGSAR